MINTNLYDIMIDGEVMFEFDNDNKVYMYDIVYCLKSKYPESKIRLLQRNHQIYTSEVEL